MLQRRQTAWGKYESMCQQQNMRSNPSLQLNIDKDSVGGFHKVLWVIWDLWCKTRCKSSEGSWEARDKAGGLENMIMKKEVVLFFLEERRQKVINRGL